MYRSRTVRGLWVVVCLISNVALAEGHAPVAKRASAEISDINVPLAANAAALQVVAGYNHTCALDAQGGVQCWGYNNGKQLGIGFDGYTNFRPHPVTGLAAGNLALGAGRTHTCVVTSSGGVKCWGYNAAGSLGDGTTSVRPVPVDVVGLGSPVQAVVAGFDHTCALTTTGGVKCWGFNAGGQLGDGTTTNRMTPVDVIGLSSGVAQIAALGHATCAITLSGGLKCWGSNPHGLLGDGTQTSRPTPVDVVGLSSGVTAVAGISNNGNAHACAAASGIVYCWGDNVDGQLGDGTIVDHLTPTPVAGINGVTGVAVGEAHSCALTDAGAVWCWGAGTGGETGSGDFSASRVPVPVADLASGVSAITAGLLHTCARLASGGIVCWGIGDMGELGHGRLEPYDFPAPVLGLVAATQVATTFSSSCALSAQGSVWCWGANSLGQLGDGTNRQRLSPVQTLDLGDTATDLQAGGGHVCVLTAGGAVKCWGSNDYGEIGDGTQIDRSAPTLVSGLGGGVLAIAVGGDHTCALTVAHAVLCWGLNNQGQVGDGTLVNRRLTPVAVVGLSSGVAAITAGDEHTCALLDGGAVQCWGANTYGQLGLGTRTTTRTPQTVTGLTGPVAALDAGVTHTCALTALGAALCWGGNAQGALGDGSGIDSTTPVQVSGMRSGVRALSAGGLSYDFARTCAILSSGALKCWGANNIGQLGDQSGIFQLTPSQVVGLSAGSSAVSVGYDHTCAVLVAGEVRCWGTNAYGQIGLGGAKWQAIPVPVVGYGPGPSWLANETFVPMLRK